MILHALVQAQCTCNNLAEQPRAVYMYTQNTLTDMKASLIALSVRGQYHNTAYTPACVAQQTIESAARSAPCNFCIKRLELAATPSQAAGRWPLINVLVTACCPDEAAC